MNPQHIGKYLVTITARHEPEQTTLADWDVMEHVAEAYDSDNLDNDVNGSYCVHEVDLLPNFSLEKDILTLHYEVTISSSPTSYEVFNRFAGTEEGTGYDEVFIKLINSGEFFWHCTNWEVETFKCYKVIVSTETEFRDKYEEENK